MDIVNSFVDCYYGWLNLYNFLKYLKAFNIKLLIKQTLLQTYEKLNVFFA